MGHQWDSRLNIQERNDGRRWAMAGRCSSECYGGASLEEAGLRTNDPDDGADQKSSRVKTWKEGSKEVSKQ